MRPHCPPNCQYSRDAPTGKPDDPLRTELQGAILAIEALYLPIRRSSWAYRTSSVRSRRNGVNSGDLILQRDALPQEYTVERTVVGGRSTSSSAGCRGSLGDGLAGVSTIGISEIGQCSRPAARSVAEFTARPLGPAPGSCRGASNVGRHCTTAPRRRAVLACSFGDGVETPDEPEFRSEQPFRGRITGIR